MLVILLPARDAADSAGRYHACWHSDVPNGYTHGLAGSCEPFVIYRTFQGCSLCGRASRDKGRWTHALSLFGEESGKVPAAGQYASGAPKSRKGAMVTPGFH